jgi:hypothetical protein
MPVSSAYFQRHDPRAPAQPTRPYWRRLQVRLGSSKLPWQSAWQSTSHHQMDYLVLAGLGP